MNTHNDNIQNMRAIATGFVTARLAGAALSGYPGEVPPNAKAAYACQDAAIALWPERIAGWKVGLVAPNARASFGATRLVGPIFSGVLRPVGMEIEPCAIFVGGFAAVEAEYVFRLGRDASAAQLDWTPAEAAALVDAMHIGVEIASSPLATINDLGPTVIASDFGNNFGLLVGPAISQWQSRALDSLRCEVSIEGKRVGQGTAASIPGGPLTALAFALSLCAERGYPLRAGQYVCTGATTGVHDIRVGEAATIAFEGIGTISCKAIAAQKYAVGGAA